MPWGGAPSTSAADAVRALVGDTDNTAPLLTDDTYVLVIATESRLYGRAALAAAMIAGHFAQSMNRKIGALWQEAKVQYDHYRDLAQWFRLEAARRGKGSVFFGGVDSMDTENRQEDTTMIQPSFNVGMMESMLLPVVPSTADTSTHQDGDGLT